MRRALLLSLLTISAGLSAGRAAAEATLFIYPTLVMFEGNQTSAEVTISNRGDEIGTFEVDWYNMSMTPEGGLVRHDEDVPWSIQPYVRYSPRRMTLAPAESQVIRVALRRDDSIPDGEYYSHMRVLTINSDPVDSADAGRVAAPAEVQGVAITARSAIAIPVVWRKGRDASAATIESAVIDPAANALRVEISRQGLLSARGFLHLVPAGPVDTSQAVAEPMPVVIYPSIERRSVLLPLPEGSTSLPAGLAVVYAADEVLTESTLVYSTRLVDPDE